MAPLAPSERAEGDAEAKPPDAAIVPHSPQPPQPRTPHLDARPTPVPHARPRLDARREVGTPRRTGASSSRPGDLLQEQLLLDFHTTVIPGSISPSPEPAFVWVTPGSCAQRYNLSMVRNMLNHMLTASPGRLQTTRVGTRVFRVLAANQNIANALVLRSPLLQIYFHRRS